MPDLLLQGAQDYEAGTPSSSEGVPVTANATANTKGNWAQVIAATSYDYQGLLIMLSHINTTARTALVDIAVGGSGAETVIIPNLLVSVGSSNSAIYVYWFPVMVPAGSAISARAQATSGSTTLKVQVLGMMGTFNQPSPIGQVTALGVTTGGATSGTSIDPGGTTNTKGSYTQIVASTSEPYTSLLIAIGQQENNARVGFYGWTLDIAIGAAASERIIIPDLLLATDATSDHVFPSTFPPIPIDIPSGTRISARAQCSGNDATDRLFDLALYAW